jgi:hypothetical protein
MRHSLCVCLPSVNLPPHGPQTPRSARASPRPAPNAPLRASTSHPHAVRHPPTSPLQTALFPPRDLPPHSSQHRVAATSVFSSPSSATGCLLLASAPAARPSALLSLNLASAPHAAPSFSAPSPNYSSHPILRLFLASAPPNPSWLKP